MKRNLLTTAILTTFLGSLWIFAGSRAVRAGTENQTNRQLMLLHYENSSGEHGLTTFDYDEKGCPGLAVWENLDNGRSSLNRLSYDENGKLVRKYREFSDGITSEELYEYSAEGNPLKETFSRSDGVTGIAAHEYDNSGILTKTHCTRYRGWFDGTLVYTRAEGKTTGATIYRNGERKGEIRYEYDSEGKLIREHWQLGSEWSQTMKYEYHGSTPTRPTSYTSASVFIAPKDDCAVAEEDYDYSGETGGPSYYGYEADGKLVAKRFVRSDGLTTNTVFLYDAQRRLTKSYRAYADGRRGVFSYRFNHDGKLAERTLKINDGSTGSEVYEYDEDGKLIGAQYKNFDSWLSGKISFEYNNSLLSKGVFKGETGFDADITFAHDELNHLVSIHWKFSYGGTQTYTFRYARHSELPSLTALTKEPKSEAESVDESNVMEKATTLTDPQEGKQTPIIFVCSISHPAQLEKAYGLAESIREFAGQYRDAPIWIFGPKELTTQNAEAIQRFAAIGVALKNVEVPDEAGWFYLSGMVFTAAEAEKQAAGKAAILVFMGSDTIVLQEPAEFMLRDGISLGYCPVMHKNISPLYSEPLDTYWHRAYSIMNIEESKVFTMVTPADNDTIRPYFNAGCLSVRPERGLFRKWVEIYLNLCGDSLLRQQAEHDEMKRVFTFQVALTGTFLNNLERSEMTELSQRYNYPIFFRELFGAKNDFHDITDVATIRYEHFFENPLPDWDKQLKGPADRIAWIKAHYCRD